MSDKIVGYVLRESREHPNHYWNHCLNKYVTVESGQLYIYPIETAERDMQNWPGAAYLWEPVYEG